MSTKIEWCDESWNPVTGCTPISEGCKNCYAERMTKRNLWGYDFTPGTQHMKRLSRPHHWKEHKRIFVCSMGDLFHAAVPFDMIEKVWDVMFDSSFDEPDIGYTKHTYMILTKRPERMLTFHRWMESRGRRTDYNNVWLGVTAENQKRANERIPILLQIPAAVRFVSVEPMLETVELKGSSDYEWLEGIEVVPEHVSGCSPDKGCVEGCPQPVQIRAPKIDWVICGAETGPGARPMADGWAWNLMRDCKDAGVPFFFKKDSLGRSTIDGKECKEFPLTQNA